MAAETVVNVALEVATTKGQIAQLIALIDEIRNREGLDDLEDWLPGEGPEDSVKLNREYDSCRFRWETPSEILSLRDTDSGRSQNCSPTIAFDLKNSERRVGLPSLEARRTNS